jgi:hypothetical protein
MPDVDFVRNFGLSIVFRQLGDQFGGGLGSNATLRINLSTNSVRKKNILFNLLQICFAAAVGLYKLESFKFCR